MWQALDSNRRVVYGHDSLAVVIWAATDEFGPTRYLEFDNQRPLTHRENLLLDLFDYSPYPTAPTAERPNGTLEIAL